MKNVLLMFLAGLATLSQAAISVQSVTVSQDAATRRVTVTYQLAGDETSGIVTVRFLDASDNPIPEASVMTLYGEVNQRVTGLLTDHTFTWNADADLPADFSSGALKAEVTVHSLLDPPEYMAVDLRFANEVKFYASSNAVPGGVRDVRYKMDHILMKRVCAKGVTWRMGTPSGETGRSSARETLHYVTFTNDFYMGVYEITQRQYRHLRKSNLYSDFLGRADADVLPMNALSYDHLRGPMVASYQCYWPNCGHDVASDSYRGLLRARTGVLFDLPTDAQWEYVCRAGVATIYPDGSPQGADNLGKFAWNSTNAAEPQPVGTRKPNAWGFYDMLGNVFEHTLDYHADMSSASVTDPVGPYQGVGVSSVGANRVSRGGSYLHDYTVCRPGVRNKGSTQGRYDKAGSQDEGARLWTPIDVFVN